MEWDGPPSIDTDTTKGRRVVGSVHASFQTSVHLGGSATDGMVRLPVPDVVKSGVPGAWVSTVADEPELQTTRTSDDVTRTARVTTASVAWWTWEPGGQEVGDPQAASRSSVVVSVVMSGNVLSSTASAYSAGMPATVSRGTTTW